MDMEKDIGARINNIDVNKLKSLTEEVKKDKSKAIKIKRIEGEWIFEVGKPQFKAEIKHDNGTTLLETDASIPMGGSGLKPDPVQYCLFGLISCFAQTFVSVVAERGIKLSKLRIAAENKTNLIKTLGLGKEPIIEGAKLFVTTSGISQNESEEIGKIALERCPGIYCLTHSIALDTEFKIE